MYLRDFYNATSWVFDGVGFLGISRLKSLPRSLRFEALNTELWLFAKFEIFSLQGDRAVGAELQSESEVRRPGEPHQAGTLGSLHDHNFGPGLIYLICT